MALASRAPAREGSRLVRRRVDRADAHHGPLYRGRGLSTIRRLERPALVIWGANNRFVRVEQAERQRESFPSAEVVVLGDSGHYSLLDSPDRVAELVLPFLKRQLT